MSFWILAALGCTRSEVELPAEVAAAEVREAPASRGWRPVLPPSVSYEVGEVRVSAPRADAPEVSLSLVGFPAVAPATTGTRTVYAHGGVTEWWEKGPRGLEQGFDIADPPRGELVLELSLDGAVADVDADGLGATLRPEWGPGLRYDGLAAWDARGVDLPARMEATDRGVRLVVDATEAVGAVTVDPLLAVAVWSAESDQAYAWFGWSVASAGDVNGDGYDDVVVGAYGSTDVSLYLGSAAGLTQVPASTLSDPSNAFSGISVASAGDVNGDGYDDVVVGASGYYDDPYYGGAAFLYLGSAAGLSTAPAWTGFPVEPYGDFGISVASAGDVNGDGYDDVVVGAEQATAGDAEEGRAYLYLGSAAGLSLTASWIADGDEVNGDFGASVASAGDVNGDGYDDVVVGAPLHGDAGQFTEGKAYVYLGSAAGLSSTRAWMGDSDLAYAQFGSSVASAGDVNGDGYSDVVVGASDNLGLGRAYVYLGSAAGLSQTPAWEQQQWAYFGSSVAAAGDTNGDGYDDVIVGAYEYDGVEVDEGAMFVYLGFAGGLSTEPVWTAEPDHAGASFGTSVASAGDVDGDGYDDVVVGSPHYDDGEIDEGAAFVYPGAYLPDSDGDSIVDVLDLCPTVPDLDQLDADGDGLGDGCDLCPLDADPLAENIDGDALPDACDPCPFDSPGDTDGDGVCDSDDGCLGDDALGDIDGDAVCADLDACAGDDATGDADEDTICDDLDACFGDDASGDSDGDEVCDDRDLCLGDDGSGDADGDLFCAFAVSGVAQDCDDLDPASFPGAPELCDGSDNSCRGYAPDDEMDLDGDGAAACAGDCDDEDPGVAPGAPEVCNGRDDDCDGLVGDEEVDLDEDGSFACDDCDDLDPASFPDAPELCDGSDNSCRGYVPDDEMDLDGDGAAACAGDCDDEDPGVAPGAPEVCNGRDDDCDGLVGDEEVDLDEDGSFACDDCDDLDPSSHAGAPDVCGDDRDNDCDGEADDLCEKDGCGCVHSGRVGGRPGLQQGSGFLVALGALVVFRRRRVV